MESKPWIDSVLDSSADRKLRQRPHSINGPHADYKIGRKSES